MNHQDTAFGMGEVAVLSAEPLIPLPEGVADLDRWEVRYDNGQRTDLSEREVELLGYLASNAGRVISRDEILLRVWRLNPQRITTRTIDMHIVHLRAKLGDNSKAPTMLHTIRGEGYLFNTNGKIPAKKDPVAA